MNQAILFSSIGWSQEEPEVKAHGLKLRRRTDARAGSDVGFGPTFCVISLCQLDMLMLSLDAPILISPGLLPGPLAVFMS